MREDPNAVKLHQAELLVREVCANLDTSEDHACGICGTVKKANWLEAKLYKKLIGCADKLEDAARQLNVEAKT